MRIQISRLAKQSRLRRGAAAAHPRLVVAVPELGAFRRRRGVDCLDGLSGLCRWCVILPVFLFYLLFFSSLFAFR